MFRNIPAVSPTPSHLTDLTASLPVGSGISTRKDGSTPGHNKRKQTLLSLLDALQELSQDDSMRESNSNGQHPSFDNDRDVPTVDEHLQVAGAETFNKFSKRIDSLDTELRNFANASRQLGSSVGILSSAFHLRERLAQILFLFRENAADLFPAKVQRQPREGSLLQSNNMKRFQQHSLKRKHKNRSPHISRPLVDDNLEPENFPEQLEHLALDVSTFLNCLNEFPEFTDEAVNASIRAFEGDLKYWSSCLEAYKTQFRYPAVQRYIHDLTLEMGEHIDSITVTLSVFIEIGVPTIRFAQKHGATNLLNLTTVATFFSAVTATTIQLSYNMTGTPLADAVNSFWFSSLVFSIAAAVNSFVGLTWKQAMYRSPGHRVPWWVLIWIKRSPLVFLVMAVVCFSIGLVCFAYSSSQSRVTCIVTSVLTAFTSFGLAAVSAWFASERWTYNHHHGQRWLGDVLTDAKNRFIRLRVIKATKTALLWSSTSLRRVPSMTVSLFRPTEEQMCENGDTEDTLPYTNTPEPKSPIRYRSDSKSMFPLEARTTTTSTISTDGQSGGGSVSGVAPPPARRGRFASAVRSVVMLQAAAATAGPASPFASRRRRTTSSTIPGDATETSRGQSISDTMMQSRGSRVAALIPKLKSLETTQELAAHQALVRHLQFSPDGKFLATSSWDRTSAIYRVGDSYQLHRTLAHPQGFVGQVAWSPSGNMLLTKLNRGIKVWTEEGVCKKTIDRPHAVQSVVWFPGGEAFLSVEGSFDTSNTGSSVVKLDLTGKVVDSYHFKRMMLHDVAVTPDGERLLGVGPLLSSPTGLHPSKSRVEKRLVVYNMKTKQYENQTPVLNEVRDITIARNGDVALVSYENKAPPQLWRLETVRDTVRLALRHTYMPKVSVNFAGPSYFGGKDDELVFCAGKAGDIHIWHQTSAVLLHHVRAQDLGGDLTCIACDATADKFTFATGSHDGAVRIWTSPPSISTSDGNNSSQLPQLPAGEISDTRSSSSFDPDTSHHIDSSPAQLRFDTQLPNETAHT